jgi:GNAT superfamily N-acetyltransferase
MSYDVLLAVRTHVPHLSGLEDAAGEVFSLEDLPEPARSAGIPRQQFESAVDAQRLWVAVEQGSEVPIGFLLVEILDGCWHVQELDVHPHHARRGTGSRLLDHALRAGASRGFATATLTTFEHVPWNAPFVSRARCSHAPAGGPRRRPASQSRVFDRSPALGNHATRRA